MHGLSGGWFTAILALTPWALSRTYWLIWGADLYRYRKRNDSLTNAIHEQIRRFVIRRIGHLVTYVKGDLELARRWYGATGDAHDCLLYPGNTSNVESLVVSSVEPLVIQVGNSADPENQHEEIFQLLALASEEFQVLTPLAYGDSDSRDNVVALGTALFGGRYTAQTELMSFDEYSRRLETVDVAVFNHRRQQAMGNTIALLGMGKRVHIRRETTQWQLLREAGIEVSAIEDGLVLSRLSAGESAQNMACIANFFSMKRLRGQWENILHG